MPCTIRHVFQVCVCVCVCVRKHSYVRHLKIHSVYFSQPHVPKDCKVNLMGVVDIEVLEVKLRGSSIWHNRVLEVTHANNGGASNVTALSALLKQQTKISTG